MPASLRPISISRLRDHPLHLGERAERRPRLAVADRQSPEFARLLQRVEPRRQFFGACHRRPLVSSDHELRARGAPREQPAALLDSRGHDRRGRDGGLGLRFGHQLEDRGAGRREPSAARAPTRPRARAARHSRTRARRGPRFRRSGASARSAPGALDVLGHARLGGELFEIGLVPALGKVAVTWPVLLVPKPGVDRVLGAIDADGEEEPLIALELRRALRPDDATSPTDTLDRPDLATLPGSRVAERVDGACVMAARVHAGRRHRERAAVVAAGRR